MIAHMGRVLSIAADSGFPFRPPSIDDPVFLQDCVGLTPDQAHELRCGQGRDR